MLAYSAKGDYINYTVVPIKVSPGKHHVDLSPKRASVLYWSTEAGSFADIYVAYGYITSTSSGYTLTVYNETGNEIISSVNIGSSINMTKIWSELQSKINDDVFAAIIWIDYSNTDTNLEVGEKAIVMIVYKNSSVQPEAYQTIKLEIKPPTGAPLTVERTMPPGIDQGVIDLG